MESHLGSLMRKHARTLNEIRLVVALTLVRVVTPVGNGGREELVGSEMVTGYELDTTLGNNRQSSIQ